MATSPFSAAHRVYVKSLYKRYLVNALDWTVRRDLWRVQAIQIRAEFERNRNVQDPRALAVILQKAESDLAARQHPDPYIPATFPGGTKWERNMPPSIEPPYDHVADAEHHEELEKAKEAEQRAELIREYEEFQRLVLPTNQG